MLGPIFMRELVTVPRRAGHYASRAALVGLLGILGITTWQATIGFSRDATLGETAGFGLLLSQIVAFVHEVLKVELPLRTVFEAPTVAEQAATILQNPDERKRIERTAQLLLQIAQLSENEVQALLNEKSLGGEVKG